MKMERKAQIPPPLFKRNSEDNEGEHWRQFSDPATLAKISAIKITAKKQKEARAAQAISSSAHLGGSKPKQINLTDSWIGQKVQEKNTASKDNKTNGALEKTTLSPLGVKPFIHSQTKDDG